MAPADLELLRYRRREADGDAVGALVLLHGRGADENDLYSLLDLLDPERRLLGITLRGPLELPPGGAHWYAVGGLGTPDPATFLPTFERAGTWLEAFAAAAGIEPARTVIGGFSQGSVLSYALGLGEGRPRPAGVIALSGFIPTVPRFALDLDSPLPPVAIGHGTYDPVIGVEWGRQARELLEGTGANVLYREYPLPHAIDPAYLDTLAQWVRARV